MEVIKFDVDKLKSMPDGFSYYILGRSYDLCENGCNEDFSLALYYYKKGIELDYPLCQYSLGISLLLGLGDVLEVDEKKGNEILIAARPKIINLINTTDSSIEKLYAEFVIGAYYYFGLGDIEKDYERAFQIIKNCADRGHIAAIYDLGANFYYNGIGTSKDLNKAKHYLEVAASEGLARAVKKLDEFVLKKH